MEGAGGPSSWRTCFLPAGPSTVLPSPHQCCPLLTPPSTCLELLFRAGEAWWAWPLGLAVGSELGQVSLCTQLPAQLGLLSCQRVGAVGGVLPLSSEGEEAPSVSEGEDSGGTPAHPMAPELCPSLTEWQPCCQAGAPETEQGLGGSCKSPVGWEMPVHTGLARPRPPAEEGQQGSAAGSFPSGAWRPAQTRRCLCACLQE